MSALVLSPLHHPLSSHASSSRQPPSSSHQSSTPRRPSRSTSGPTAYVLSTSSAEDNGSDGEESSYSVTHHYQHQQYRLTQSEVEGKEAEEGLLDVPLGSINRPVEQQQSEPEEEDEGIASSGGKRKKDKGKRREKVWVCDVEGCPKRYGKVGKFDEHLKQAHQGTHPIACSEPTCKRTFLREWHLQAHLQIHAEELEKPYICERPSCPKRFKTQQHLTRHSESCVGKYKCDDCSESFNWPQNLRTHRLSAHAGPPGALPYKCTFLDCVKSYPNNQKLEQHLKSHDTSRYTCAHPSHPSPGESFPTWSHLQAHLKSAHPPTCPYPSCVNRKPFKSRKNLKAHLQVHKEHEEDERALGEEDTTDEEARRRGKRGKKRAREDDVVGEEDMGVEWEIGKGKGTEMKIVGETGRLKRRKVTSESIAGKDFACEVEGCGKSFKRRQALQKHTDIVHLNLRPFPCPLIAKKRCSQPAYAHKHTLLAHIAKKHPEIDGAKALEEQVAKLEEGMGEGLAVGIEMGLMRGEDADDEGEREDEAGRKNMEKKEKKARGELTGVSYKRERRIVCPYGVKGFIKAPPPPPPPPSAEAATTSSSSFADPSSSSNRHPLLPPRPPPSLPFPTSLAPSSSATSKAHHLHPHILHLLESAREETLSSGRRACEYRCSRAYDLRRHLGKMHGVQLTEEEARALIRESGLQAGE